MAAADARAGGKRQVRLMSQSHEDGFEDVIRQQTD